jgi:adiponectin receptor
MMQSAILRIKTAFIGDKEEAPPFIQDNKYIKRGYRIDHNNLADVSKSLCTCHNETVNIWTHLSGSIIFLAIFIVLPSVIVPRRFEVGHAMAETLK